MLLRKRTWTALLAATAAVAAAGGRLGRAIEERAGEALRRAGMSARAVQFSWLGPLRLEGLTRPLPGGGLVTVEVLDVRWRFLGGSRAASHVAGLEWHDLRVARGPLSLRWPHGQIELTSTLEPGVERLVLQPPSHDGSLQLTRGLAQARGSLIAHHLDIDTLAVSWNGETVMNPGVWTGRASWTTVGGRFRSEGLFRAEEVRLSAPRPLEANGGQGLPTALDLEWSVEQTADALEVREASAQLRGFDLRAQGTLRRAGDGRTALDVTARCDLGPAFRTAGLTLPIQIPSGEGDLGQADLSVSLRGVLAEPGTLMLAPRLRFEADAKAVGALAYLRRPFPYRPDMSPGVVVDLDPASSDFIPIGHVPPLLQRALVISEDAGFRQHCGLDLAEVAVAWAEQEQGRVRGASTITQQLVKNLFLSGEKTYGRKVKEAALALMVDAAVDKDRQLEIYLNIIEWGPRLHGLVPAARHYFGKRPDELTPKEIAFLICLIPNPVRYHQAHEAGRMGPGMEQLVHNLLAKLRSVDGIDDEEYQAALAEELAFAPESP